MPVSIRMSVRLVVRLALALHVVALMGICLDAKIIYVREDGNSIGPGDSWSTAFDHFISAIANASPQDSIFMAEGIYWLPQDTQLYVQGGIRLFGGFAGYESSLDERDPDNKGTKIASNNYCSKIVLDSFVISSELNQMTFVWGNSAYDIWQQDPCIQVGQIGPGGVLLVRPSSDGQINDIKIVRCQFSGNQARLGGSIAFIGGAGSRSRFTLDRCEFYKNYARNRGGGVYFYYAEGGQTLSIKVDSCSFYENICELYGGASLAFIFLSPKVDTLLVSNCKFIDNEAQLEGGGGVYLKTFGNLLEGMVLIRNSSFVNSINNAAFSSTGQSGGSALVVRSGAKIENCLFDGNYSSDGGVISGSHLDVSNCIFANNYSKTKGAVFYLGESEQFDSVSIRNVFKNCLFLNNRSDEYGSVFYHRWPPSRDSILNCIFWNNHALLDSAVYYTKFGGEIDAKLMVSDIGGDVSPSTFFSDETTPGNSFETDLSTWILDDPAFVDTLSGRYWISRCSPMINKGNNDWNSLANDIGGNPRIREGRIDLGPYERDTLLPAWIVKQSTCATDPNGEVSLDSVGITWPAEVVAYTSSGVVQDANTLTAGMYTILGQDSEGCLMDTMVVITEPDSISAEFLITGSQMGAMDGSILIQSIQGGEPGYSVLWYDGDLSWSKNLLSPGYYSLTVLDTLLCMANWNVEVPVITGSASLKQDEIGFEYANPVQGALNYTLTAPVGRELTYSLWSVSGRKVVEGQLEVGSNLRLPVPFIESGSYWLKIADDRGTKSYPIIIIR